MGVCIGIDIGSTSAKTVVLDGDRNLLHRTVQPTGWSSVATAEAIREHLEGLGFSVEDAEVVATGYGRVSVPYATRCVTEITCHARGARFIHHCDDMTVIDIGGQDTKIIDLAAGQVRDFIMNDKCSAGTGRFLEVMAGTLGIGPEELCHMAAAGGGVTISSMCTVFAESEVISLIGRGEPRENIAYAVVDSIVRKVVSQTGRLPLSKTVCLTGGLCEVEDLRRSLSRALNRDVLASPDGRYAGAIGAALSARPLRKHEKGEVP